MAKLAAHEYSALGVQLLTEMRGVLAASQDQRVRALEVNLPSLSDDRWRLVATGEYNAGKSTLLRALTNDPSIRIDADVATESAKEYEWHGVLLVDTPGVKAGVDLHDERAEAAVRDADLVVFVLTVGLFDDTTGQHFRHVALELGKLKQMVVIINKANQMRASPGIRRAAVQTELGELHALPPLVECDGRSMLVAVTDDDPEIREYEEGRSGRSDLLAALDALTLSQGAQGRLRKPFNAIIAMADDVAPLLVADDAEEALVALLARRRECLALSRQRLLNALDHVFATVTDAITGAGEQVIASARNGIPEAPAVERFDAEAQEAARSLERRVKEVFERELANLEADERGLAAGPEALLVDELLSRRPSSRSSFPSGSDGPLSPVANLVADYLAKQGTNWLKETIAGGHRPGSPMHSLVTSLGHGLGHKFKPWEAVRWAKRLNTAVNVAMTAFQFYKELDKVQSEERAERAALLDLRTRVREAAVGLIDEAKDQVSPLIERFYQEASAPVAALEEQVTDLTDRRTGLRHHVESLEIQAREALSRLDAPSGKIG